MENKEGKTDKLIPARESAKDQLDNIHEKLTQMESNKEETPRRQP